MAYSVNPSFCLTSESRDPPPSLLPPPESSVPQDTAPFPGHPWALLPCQCPHQPFSRGWGRHNPAPAAIIPGALHCKASSGLGRWGRAAPHRHISSFLLRALQTLKIGLCRAVEGSQRVMNNDQSGGGPERDRETHRTLTGGSGHHEKHLLVFIVWDGRALPPFKSAKGAPGGHGAWDAPRTRGGHVLCISHPLSRETWHSSAQVGRKGEKWEGFKQGLARDSHICPLPPFVRPTAKKWFSHFQMAGEN